MAALPTTDAFDALCARARGCFACRREGAPPMNFVHVLGPTNGPLDADVLFVAEAPGRLGAARTGIPMTSDVTGRRFHAFLADAGLVRERVFVTNSVLCNPLSPSGHNRRPSTREVAACRDLLGEQLRLVRAPVVVALGSVALDTLRRIAPHDAVLSRDAARSIAWPGPDGRARALVPLYHPSIQATLTRPHETQRADWRRLGAIVRDRARIAI